MSSTAVCLLTSFLLAFCHSSGEHREMKRSIIYPMNSVIQFSLGLALPADVRGRNIATNSGILINIDLPTNISQLRPPQRSLRSTPEHAGLLQRITDIVGLHEGTRDDCLARSVCILQENSHLQNLLYDIFEAVIDSILVEEYNEDFFKRRKRYTGLSKEECFKFKEKCNLEFFVYLENIFKNI